VCFDVVIAEEFCHSLGATQVGYDLNGERMPELRSGARRSKRLGDLQPGPLPVEQGENWAQPAQNRTRRRVGGGRGRGGNATAVGKGPSPAVPTRRTAAGRGRGARLIDLDPEPCEVLPEPVALGAPEPVYNHVEVVANNNIAMEGGSADKVAVAEEEPSTTPVPERVYPSCMLLLLDCIISFSKYNFFNDKMVLFSITVITIAIIFNFN